MSHILRLDNPTHMREITYSKWCAIWQTFIYPDRCAISETNQMRYFFVFSFALFLITDASAQESAYAKMLRQDSLDFVDFVSYFDTPLEYDINNSRESIPFKYYYKFFRQEYNEYDVSIEPYILVNKKKNVTVIILIHHPEGGFSGTYVLGTFKPNGQLVNSNNIGNVTIDSSGGNYCDLNIVNENLLEIQRYHYQVFDETRHLITSQILYEYYHIADDQFYKIDQYYSHGRSYPMGSFRLLKPEEIANASKSSLELMKNEIFADHGLIFKSDKLIEYFEKQDWYDARYKDVNQSLTELELENIRRILKKD